MSISSSESEFVGSWVDWNFSDEEKTLAHCEAWSGFGVSKAGPSLAAMEKSAKIDSSSPFTWLEIWFGLSLDFSKGDGAKGLGGGCFLKEARRGFLSGVLDCEKSSKSPNKSSSDPSCGSTESSSLPLTFWDPPSGFSSIAGPGSSKSSNKSSSSASTSASIGVSSLELSSNSPFT